MWFCLLSTFVSCYHYTNQKTKKFFSVSTKSITMCTHALSGILGCWTSVLSLWRVHSKSKFTKKKIKNNKNKLSCCLLRLLLTQLSVCVTRFTQSKNHFFFIKLKNMQQKFKLKPKICYNEKFQIVFRWQNTWIVRWVWIESG